MTGDPGDRRTGPRRESDRAGRPSQQDVLDEAERRHKERRQYAPQPSGWGDLTHRRNDKRPKPDER